MAVNENKKTPLYAVVGAGDLVVEKVRSGRLTPAAALRSVPDVYTDLVERGSRLVTRVRNQKSTQDLQRQASTTRSQAKGAATAVKNTAKATRTRTKATTTSAKKTATQAKQAASDAADKVGD